MHPDGHLVTITIPLECDPFWLDRGDPPPEEKSNPDIFVNPGPETQTY
jgi:hypothetical protein